MLISVVIPVAPGRETNLVNCLHALNCQTLPKSEWEVIVVQDGGEHDTILRAIEPEIRLLQWKFVLSEKYQPKTEIEPNHGIPPRNLGARIGFAPFILFLDSDIILDKNALALYKADIEANPDRIIAGMYDWMPPARITEEMVEQGLDSVYTLDERDGELHMRLLVKQSPYKFGGPTHNVCRDHRRPMFFEKPHTHVYSGEQSMHAALGQFSGNLLMPAKLFWTAGGFWEDLSAGLVDDGAFGLTCWHLGMGISFDPRIRGAHQYHDRNVEYIQTQSAKEVDLIDRRFRLGKYADGGERVVPKNIHILTQEAQAAWGVDKWRRDF